MSEGFHSHVISRPDSAEQLEEGYVEVSLTKHNNNNNNNNNETGDEEITDKEQEEDSFVTSISYTSQGVVSTQGRGKRLLVVGLMLLAVVLAVGFAIRFSNPNGNNNSIANTSDLTSQATTSVDPPSVIASNANNSSSSEDDENNNNNNKDSSDEPGGTKSNDNNKSTVTTTIGELGFEQSNETKTERNTRRRKRDNNTTAGYFVDYNCTFDSDCEEKDVGNCCGSYYECVNIGFIPDHKQSCPPADNGGGIGSDICGWDDIDGCVCIQGECQGVQVDEPSNETRDDITQLGNETTAVYTVDYSCQADLDCKAKDVGNCCGTFYECVNVDFIPDRNQSCNKGGSGICGWSEIDSCICVEGKCKGVQADDDETLSNNSSSIEPEDEEDISQTDHNDTAVYSVDYSCTNDGDCEAKDVGNCCGTYYKCVNIYFIPDRNQSCPQGSGGSGICGWSDIDRCVCTEGQCQGMQADDGEDANTTSPSNDTVAEQDVTQTSKNDTAVYTVDYNCTIDRDCEAKDVGNCCGTYYECVNKKFVPDRNQSCPPAEDGGIGSGICGWSEIDWCVCTQEGRCEGRQADMDDSYDESEEDSNAPSNAPSDMPSSHETDSSDELDELSQMGNETEAAVYTVDYSCSVDEDCDAKDVGNCCGTYYECVNIDFFPDRNKSCPDKNSPGICGWAEIDWCACVEGRCEGFQRALP